MRAIQAGLRPGLRRLFAPGDSLQIDGVLTESGRIVDDMTLRVTSSTLSAGITWLVAPGPLRTVGVNVDLFDANNLLVASDSFDGVTDGQAFSQFALGGLAPGDYTLRFTGSALNGGRYRINLSTDADAPGFEPIPLDQGPSNVPEPHPLVLLLLGVASLVAVKHGLTPDRWRSGPETAPRHGDAEQEVPGSVRNLKPVPATHIA